MKLKGINNITNMSYMLDYCSSLLSLSDISNFNFCNVTDMIFMFSCCSSFLKYLPDISNWSTKNINNMI